MWKEKIKQIISFCVIRFLDNFFNNAYYQAIGIREYFYHRFILKSHIIKIKTGYQWVDADDRMFLACFQILKEFVENELSVPFGFNKRLPDYRGFYFKGEVEKDMKIIDLYYWYKNDYPQLSYNYSAPNNLNFSASHKTIIDQKFEELISLRSSLWT